MTCVICNGRSVSSTRGVFSPFVSFRVWGKQQVAIEVAHCRDCDFSFAVPRFSEREEKFLYSDYRGSEYQTMREKFEPWYTEAFNRGLCNADLGKRRTPIQQIFSEHIPVRINTILDFGGDRGDLFDGVIPDARTYVYDISNVTPAKGVTAVHSLEECKRVGFDLITCSNVLEHVGDPRGLLRDIKAIGRAGTVIFLEVPSEKPFSWNEMTKRTAQELVLLVSRPRIGLSLLPHKFITQVHEHINFYSLKSLERLVQVEKCELLASGCYETEGYSLGPLKVFGGMTVWCLAQCPA